MKMKYDHKAIEPKWQEKWEETGVFHAENGSDKPKYYALIEFPYPSGQGLHVGHPRPYTALDVVARKRRMQGYNVLYPIGWDAFGLPTENYAIKNHVHPAEVTKQNIARFKKQIQSLGISFDWSREISTTDPAYYKWTQWIFLQLFKAGLAYKKEMNVNWCTSCKCVLANEEVVNGVCERCGSEVVHKVKSQWMLKITEYAQRLIDDLDLVDYPERVKTQQKNWIGRSTGAEVDFDTTAGDKLTVYTTRPDTLYGATYMVVSPEHPYLEKWADKLQNLEEIKAYQEQAARKSDFERTEVAKEKTGVKLQGVSAINPLTGREIPIFISDYVLVSYGTGAIMAVPAHDTRDWEFAKKFGLPIIEVVKGGDVEKEAFTDCETGIMVNSGILDGLTVEEAKKKHHPVPGGEGHRPCQGELQAAGLGVLPPAVLGRAHPRGVLREVRLGAPAGEPAALAAARGGVLRAHGQRGIPPGPHDRLGEHHLPPLRRPRQAGDGHHAPVGWFLLVLPAVYGPPQRRSLRFPGGTEVLVSHRLV